jgi:hypothetical protein
VHVPGIAGNKDADGNEDGQGDHNGDDGEQAGGSAASCYPFQLLNTLRWDALMHGVRKLNSLVGQTELALVATSTLEDGQQTPVIYVSVSIMLPHDSGVGARPSPYLPNGREPPVRTAMGTGDVM